MTNRVAVIRGGGDLGTGAALRLQRAGWRVLISELAQPIVIRRSVALASAVYAGSIDVEGTLGVRCDSIGQVERAWGAGHIAVMVDPDRSRAAQLAPTLLVDAIMAKRNTGTVITDAPLVVALGPGFTVNVDCHAVVETARGHYLGRVYYQGAALADTGTPGKVGGQDSLRVLRAPVPGEFHPIKVIGDRVKVGSVVAFVGDAPVISPLDGVVRGILHEGLRIAAGFKIGDIDPRGDVNYCFTVSDKAWAVGGGVLEAALCLMQSR